MDTPSPGDALFSPEHLVGRKIAGRYLVRRLIARGGMGAVYEAEQVPIGRRLALKVLLPLPGSGEPAEFERRFRLEAEALARLSHPNCVTLHDFGETGEGTCFLVMEYIEGRSLSRILEEEGALEPRRALELMLQVCRALVHSHRKGIIHRDLKPSNLLVTQAEGEPERVKVVDFGLVKLARDDRGITRVGTILGSPHCMSPEQVQGEEVDLRSDIYALGIVLYRCLIGEYPFSGPNAAATMIAHLQQPMPSFAEARPGQRFPPGLEAIVRKCLEKERAARYQDMKDLTRTLHALVSTDPIEFSGVSAVMEGLPPTGELRLEAREAPGWVRWALLALALILLASAMRLALDRTGAPSSPPPPASPTPNSESP